MVVCGVSEFNKVNSFATQHRDFTFMLGIVSSMCLYLNVLTQDTVDIDAVNSIL